MRAYVQHLKETENEDGTKESRKGRSKRSEQAAFMISSEAPRPGPGSYIGLVDCIGNPGTLSWQQTAPNFSFFKTEEHKVGYFATSPMKSDENKTVKYTFPNGQENATSTWTKGDNKGKTIDRKVQRPDPSGIKDKEFHDSVMRLLDQGSKMSLSRTVQMSPNKYSIMGNTKQLRCARPATTGCDTNVGPGVYGLRRFPSQSRSMERLHHRESSSFHSTTRQQALDQFRRQMVRGTAGSFE
jgi:hypothetical protein